MPILIIIFELALFYILGLRRLDVFDIQNVQFPTENFVSPKDFIIPSQFDNHQIKVKNIASVGLKLIEVQWLA